MTFINGWREAPHCWKTFVLKPISYTHIPKHSFSLQIVGFCFAVTLN